MNSEAAGEVVAEHALCTCGSDDTVITSVEVTELTSGFAGRCRSCGRREWLGTWSPEHAALVWQYPHAEAVGAVVLRLAHVLDHVYGVAQELAQLKDMPGYAAISAERGYDNIAKSTVAAARKAGDGIFS